LTSLQKLKLSENRLERIESGAFAPLPVAGTLRVELADNPLHCDCALAWILDWAEVALARARCAQPVSLQGLLVSAVVTTAAVLFLWENQERLLLEQQEAFQVLSMIRSHI
jgi:hypothetical protein